MLLSTVWFAVLQDGPLSAILFVTERRICHSRESVHRRLVGLSARPVVFCFVRGARCRRDKIAADSPHGAGRR